MRNFDPNNYPPLIGRWIMCKGSDLPPLQWTQRANRLGAQQLCKLKPAQLLEDSKLTDVQAGSCILAGMMLWNGLVNVAEALCRQFGGSRSPVLAGHGGATSGPTGRSQAALSTGQATSNTCPTGRRVLGDNRPGYRKHTWPVRADSQAARRLGTSRLR